VVEILRHGNEVILNGLRWYTIVYLLDAYLNIREIKTLCDVFSPSDL